VSSADSEWTRKTRSGIAWSNAAFLGARIFSSVSLLILARLLSPGDFGVVAAITVFIAILEMISDIGMRATVIYEQEEAVTRRVHVAFTINLGLTVLLSAACVALAPVVAGFFHIEGHTDLFRLAALNPMLKGLGNIHDALLMRGMEFRRRALPEVVQAATRGAISIPLAFAGFGATGLLVGFLSGTLAWTIVHWRIGDYRPRFRFDRKIARSMVGYGTGASLVDIQAAIGSRVDLIAIGRVLGERALGLYTIAFRVPELLIEAVAWNTGTVAFAALSKRRHEDDSELADATRSLIRYQALYAIPAGAILAVLAPVLIVVLFGQKWEEAGGVASAISVMAAVTAITFPLGDVFKALGRQRVLVVMQLTMLPFLIAAIVVSAPAGIVAVAWVRTTVRTLYVGSLTIVVSRSLHETVRSMVAPMLPAVAAGIGALAGAGAVRLLWSDLSFGPLLAGGTAGICGAALALQLCSPATARELRSQLGSLRSRRATPAQSGA
jgi:PST family polysaccharide transporter